MLIFGITDGIVTTVFMENSDEDINLAALQHGIEPPTVSGEAAPKTENERRERFMLLDSAIQAIAAAVEGRGLEGWFNSKLHDLGDIGEEISKSMRDPAYTFTDSAQALEVVMNLLNEINQGLTASPADATKFSTPLPRPEVAAQAPGSTSSVPEGRPAISEVNENELEEWVLQRGSLEALARKLAEKEADTLTHAETSALIKLHGAFNALNKPLDHAAMRGLVEELEALLGRSIEKDSLPDISQQEARELYEKDNIIREILRTRDALKRAKKEYHDSLEADMEALNHLLDDYGSAVKQELNRMQELSDTPLEELQRMLDEIRDELGETAPSY